METANIVREITSLPPEAQKQILDLWLVPFVETDDEIFLKTIIPSRKATKKYLGR